MTRHTFDLLPMLVCVFMLGCANNDQAHTDDHAHQEDDHGHSHGSSARSLDDTTAYTGELELSKAQLAALNISFTHPERLAMEGSVRLTGKVKTSPVSKAQITSPIGAKVVSVLVDEGEHVKKGQALMQLSDIGFLRLQQEYLAARAQHTMASAELQRQAALVAGDAGARRSLEQAQAQADEVSAMAASLEGQLGLLGVDPGSLDAGSLKQTFAVRSPIEGEVNELRIFLGSHVEPTTVLTEVIDLHHFHLHLNAYERDLGLLKIGRRFPFEVMNLPGRSFTGELFSIGRTFDDDGRSIPLHAHVEKGSENLIEGMSVVAMIPTGEHRQLSVPESALARSGDKGFVYIAYGEAPDGGRKFKEVEVLPGITLNGRTAIIPLQRIDPTTSIVGDGVFYLRSMLTNVGE